MEKSWGGTAGYYIPLAQTLAHHKHSLEEYFWKIIFGYFWKNWDKFLKKAMLTFTKFTKIIVFCKMDSAKLVVSVLGNFILWNEMLILWVTWRSFHNFYCKLFASIRCRKWWQHTKLGLVTQKVIRDKEDSFYQSSRIILKIQNVLHFCSLLLKIELVGFPSRCQLAVIIWKSKIIISLIDAPIEMKDLNPIYLRDMYISSVYQSLFSLNYEVYGCFNHTFYDIPKFAV